MNRLVTLATFPDGCKHLPMFQLIAQNALGWTGADWENATLDQFLKKPILIVGHKDDGSTGPAR